jgi:hypothetical protein
MTMPIVAGLAPQLVIFFQQIARSARFRTTPASVIVALATRALTVKMIASQHQVNPYNPIC